MSGPIVVDLRRPQVRAVWSAWRRWERRGGWLVTRVARATAALTRSRLQARLARRGEPPHHPFVLSVGNLSVGGTGKTPLVIDLAEQLARRGRRGVVLTRGYGSSYTGVLDVRPEDERAGDEARLMASRLPDWTIVQARHRERGFRSVLARPPAGDVVILEDGHQTAGVPRHLDVLVCDRWRIENDHVLPETGLVVPWGPYREDRTGAERAGVWLLPASGATGNARWGETENGRVPVLRFGRRLILPPVAKALLDGPYGIFCGIARPERFEAGCTELLAATPAVAVRFDDHVAYGRRHCYCLQRLGERHAVALWLTTEKDWIKIRDLANRPVVAAPVALSITWPEGETLPDLVEERLARR